MRQRLLLLQSLALLVLLFMAFIAYSHLDTAQSEHARARQETDQVLEALVDIRYASQRIVSSVAEYGLLSRVPQGADADEDRTTELTLIREGQSGYTSALNRYRELVTRYYPDARPGAERLFYEGGLMQRHAQQLLDALVANADAAEIYHLKALLEASETRFVELAGDLIRDERQRRQRMHRRIDSAHTQALVSLVIGSLLLLLINLFQYRAERQLKR